MLVLIALLSYILGSIPFGFIVGKVFFKTDLRKLGSGNVGATNALRNFGRLAGFTTFLFDFLKGSLACYLGEKFGGEAGQAVAMFFVVIGHMYSFILKFKSGKGVATSFGALLAIDYRFALTLLAIFIVLVLIFRIVSLSSIITAVIAAVLAVFSYKLSYITLAIILIASLIVYKHKDNIKRLKLGEEKKIF
ncbi:MAG: glycerol-3-phosphate 1-O-acyltransferase PlsY [Anaerococcus prevotii]|uniref:glycerol-3-phosphate 1-O-acyltransferase PlsY n=1 Tax=Anaerococcus prevotii TaxID=33034 RepID=UPI002901EDEE|nr:glycerol-3-phosphate 1-O-acyltransferase PlsY [Anaerococcus prevotii]MDU2558841.1 glycerol-3-phosphate 1-O-acyltransferase PlsY [Anaerococcus prevotii]MDU2583860.1 glycerol-3-phosphate 1-O-acyltransferase PlsY [Anaerococcus prevotii]MDU3136321.1 glycerol-3-phosphate 1-O-acyltransferase PlsY [Anaerococcus prevotii]